MISTWEGRGGKKVEETRDGEQDSLPPLETADIHGEFLNLRRGLSTKKGGGGETGIVAILGYSGGQKAKVVRHHNFAQSCWAKPEKGLGPRRKDVPIGG